MYADEIRQRILNGDGDWIKEEHDPEAIFRLDRYHIYQEVLRKISDKTYLVSRYVLPNCVAS